MRERISIEIDKKERGVKMKREKEKKNQLKQQININGEIKITK